jgi:EmrB/QacA subfamily drug resistance transporter
MRYRTGKNVKSTELLKRGFMSDQTNQNQKKWVLIATILASGVVFLSGSVVNVALPKIASGLNTGLSGLQWVVDGYLLTLSSLIILGGALGDQFGRRLICLIGLLGFGVSLLGSGLAGSTAWLIAFRALQGLFGALMVPQSLAILRVVYTRPENRGQAISAWSGWTGIATVIGPMLGGFLVDTLSWRWAFFISIPLVLVTFYLVAKYVPETSGEQNQKRLDWWGSLLVTLSLAGIAFGIIEGPVIGWGSPLILGALIGGAAAMALFLLVESRIEHPLLPLSLFKSRNFTGANLTTLAVYAALQGSMFILVLYIQNVMGYSALQAGLLTAPISLILLLLSSYFGKLANRFGPRLFMTFGPIVMGIGLFILALLNVDSSIWFNLLPAILVFGLGLSATVAPLTDTVMSSAPGQHSGVAAAFNNMVSRVAALLAVAVLGAILSLGFTERINQQLQDISLPEETQQELQQMTEDPAGAINEDVLTSEGVQVYESAFTLGYQRAIRTGAILAAAGGLVAFFAIKNPDSREENEKKIE